MVSAVIALGAASTVGTSLFVAVAVVVPGLGAAHQPRSFVAEEVRVTGLTLFVSLLVLVAMDRPARLRRADTVVLIAAGLVAYPFFLLASIPVARTAPPVSLMVLIAVALAIGVASTVWSAASGRRAGQPEPAAAGPTRRPR